MIVINKILSILLLGVTAIISIAAKELPENAIPFILDSHVYIQATLADTVPVSLIYDTGADRLYLDKDYMELSDFGKLPLKKGKAKMGGARNDGVQTISIIIDPIPVSMGNVTHSETITPIINLREILGSHSYSTLAAGLRLF